MESLELAGGDVIQGRKQAAWLGGRRGTVSVPRAGGYHHGYPSINTYTPHIKHDALGFM